MVSQEGPGTAQISAHRESACFVSCRCVHLSLQACPPGQSTGGFEGATGCTNCTAGSYRAAGMENCTAAPAGFFALEGAAQFTKCPPGTYSAVPGSTQVRVTQWPCVTASQLCGSPFQPSATHRLTIFGCDHVPRLSRHCCVVCP